MRNYALAAVLSLVFILGGCSGKEEKINIIKGAGNANNSLVLSFNELCPGTVEGFGITNNDVIVSRRVGEKLEIDIFNTLTKQKELLLSAVSVDSFSSEVSPNGKRLISGSQLIDIQNKTAAFLPPIANSIAKPGGSLNSPYSFIGEEDVVLTDPYYYLSKYFKVVLKSLQMNYPAAPSVILAGDLNNKVKPESYKDLKAPDIDGILEYKLFLQDLRFVFIGFKGNINHSSLYIFDFIERNFVLVDSGVKTFSISPDGSKLCYVKSLGGHTPVNAIYISDFTGIYKKELARLAGINTVAWSSDGQWLAYSGGSTTSDIFVIKADGSAQEQLTHNISAEGIIAWKGNRLAFTSNPDKANRTPKAYLITLNVDNSQLIPFSSIKPKNQQLYSQLLGFLQNETTLNMNKKKLDQQY